MHRKNEDDE
jgi:hypothetical protein